MFNRTTRKIKKVGKIAGFIAGYMVFTFFLFFLLFVSKRLPAGWSIVHISSITILLTLGGHLLKKTLQ